jgi:NADH dehydrogenase
MALAVSQAIGIVLRDVVLTRDEVAGLTADLLVTDGPAAGNTRLSDWIRLNASSIGARYASELARHYR